MNENGSAAEADFDPSRLFRALREQDPPEEFWAGFWPSVRAGIREAELRRDSVLTRGRAVLLGSSAGVMVAAAILAFAFLVVPAPGTLPRALPVAPPQRAAASRVEEIGPPPVLEELRSASARVYTFHVGEAPDATDVILIVDEKIDI